MKRLAVMQAKDKVRLEEFIYCSFHRTGTTWNGLVIDNEQVTADTGLRISNSKKERLALGLFGAIQKILNAPSTLCLKQITCTSKR